RNGEEVKKIMLALALALPFLPQVTWTDALWRLGETTVALLFLAWFLGVRYIPHDRVGVVEKLWSGHGSLKGGQIVALGAEAGFQSRLLRGGVHAGFSPLQFRIHMQPLVSVPAGRIAYVYARDGAPLPPTQTLGRNVSCNHFQDAEAFLRGGGQRGRQRAILREGVYAINPALFVVITESDVYALRDHNPQELQMMASWQAELHAIGAFEPVIVGRPCKAADPLNHD